MKKVMSKKLTKTLVLAVCAILLVAGSVMGTLAYLTSQTDTVTNTFTYGNVAITMNETDTDEYGKVVDNAAPVISNNYVLIPGLEYTKNTTIHVAQGSEECYLFVKIDSRFATIDPDFATNLANKGWTPISEGSDVYYYSTADTEVVNAKNAQVDIKVIDSFKVNSNLDSTTLPQLNVDGSAAIIVGYAVQAEGFDNAADAWAATFGKTANSQS